MDHMQFLMERGDDEDGDSCGHALMASCPPAPEGHGISYNDCNHLTGIPGQRTWDLSKSDLTNLLDLSNRLNLDGEITPIMAWSMVLNHSRFSDFTLADFKKMADDLLPKIRCYG